MNLNVTLRFNIGDEKLPEEAVAELKEKIRGWLEDPIPYFSNTCAYFSEMFFEELDIDAKISLESIEEV